MALKTTSNLHRKTNLYTCIKFLSTVQVIHWSCFYFLGTTLALRSVTWQWLQKHLRLFEPLHWCAHWDTVGANWRSVCSTKQHVSSNMQQNNIWVQIRNKTTCEFKHATVEAMHLYIRHTKPLWLSNVGWKYFCYLISTDVSNKFSILCFQFLSRNKEKETLIIVEKRYLMILL